MMRLRALEVSDFRKFDRPVRLDGLADGINVLAEPNEFGKSTLLAAIKAVLFEKHRARGKVGERMQHHRNATSPVLGLRFELADGVHHIEKRFMHREPYARLILPDGTRLEGDAAEERLQALLGFDPAGARGANADSLGLWGALWVGQKEAAQQPALPETGRATLHACLEAELGAVAGGDRSGALGQEVRAELFKLLDGNGKPKGRLREVAEGCAAAEDGIARLRDKRAAFEGIIGDLTRRRRDLAGASNAAEDARLGTDLAEARRRRDVALRHKDRLQAAVAALDLVERRHADAVAETERRAARRAAIAAVGTTLADAAGTETRLQDEQDAAAAELRLARDVLAATEREAAAAALAQRAANDVSALVMRSDRLTHQSAQLDRAVAAQAAISRLTGELSAQPATAARLKAVTDATLALDRARSLLDAQATEVEFALDVAAGDRVEVAGTVLPPGRTTLRVVGDTAITIAGLGRMWVRPAIRDRQVLLDTVAAAETGLAEALTAIGAADPAEAARRAAARTELAGQLGLAEAALRADTPGDAAGGLKPGL